MAKIQPSPSKQSSKAGSLFSTSLWLIVALLSGVTALVLWMFSSAPSFDKKVEVNTEDVKEETVSSIGNIHRIDDFNGLENAVQPISFDTVIRDLRSYPAEFKEPKFIKQSKDKWTVQVMDVSEHEIITDYLNSRKDREKFAYFRYRDDENQERYILMYDIMKSKQMAERASTTINFDLPENVGVVPKKMGIYLSIIENYELSQPIQDLSEGRMRNIRLQPTRREIQARSKPAEPKTPDASSQNEKPKMKQETKESNQEVDNSKNKSDKPQPKPESKPQPKPEPKPQPKPEPKPQPKPELSQNTGIQSNSAVDPLEQPQLSLQSGEEDKIKQLIDKQTQ